MVRLPQPGQDDGVWGNVLNEYLGQSHAADGSLKPAIVSEANLSSAVVTKLNDSVNYALNSAAVHTSGAESIAGVKTFSSSPIIPDPSSPSQASTKAYVDSTVAAAVPAASNAVYRYRGRPLAVPKPNGRVIAWTGATASWTTPSAAQTVTKASTTLPLGGVSSYEIVTKGDGAFISGVHSSRTAFNLTTNANYQLSFYIWVDDPTKLAALNVYAGSSSGNSYYWDILLAAPSADKPTLPAARWRKITLLPPIANVQGTPVDTSLTRFVINITDNNQVATVRLSNRIEWEPNARALWPKGVVSICFDDSNISTVTLAAPVLAGYGYPAALVPITSRLSSGNAAYYTWNDARTLQTELGWQVMSHCRTVGGSPDVHGGFTLLTAAQMVDEICGTKEAIQAQGLWGSDDFAYPNGAYGAGVETGMVADHLRPYIRSARATSSTRRIESLPAGNIMQYGAASDVGGPSVSINTYTNVSTGLLNKVATGGTWATVTFHDIIASGTAGSNQCTVADLQAFVDRINALGIAVATPAEVLDSLQ